VTVEPSLPGLTPKEFAAGLRSLAAFPFQHLADAVESRFADRAKDLLAAEDILSLLKDFGVPYMGMARFALEMAAFMHPNDPAQPDLFPSESANGG
jgi:hypothetical protein